MALINVGACLGALVAGTIADAIGRKKTFLLSCPLLIFGWFVLAKAYNLYFIYLGRLITGMCSGSILAVSSVRVKLTYFRFLSFQLTNNPQNEEAYVGTQ